MEPSVLSAFKALGDPSRMTILGLLTHGELCACKLLDQLSMAQPTLSHHMKVLCDAGLVRGRREGKWTHYHIEQGKVREMQEVLSGFAHTMPQDHLTPQDQGKTRLYVLTGFLGAGKTTVLRALLDALQNQRVGVIQNEFGKLGIDGDILRGDQLELVEINRGSIFCSCLKLSFVQALAQLADKNLQYLFVESSGLGDPSNYREILDAAKQLAGDRYDFRGAICLVDAAHFERQLDDLETVHRQLKHCHLAVITKVDLVTPQQLERIKALIRQINPACPITVSSNGDVNLSFLRQDLLQYAWAEGEQTTNSEEAKPKTILLTCDGAVEQSALAAVLQDVKDQVYRVKGFFLLDSGWHQVDLVGGRLDLKPCDPRERSQLVVISKIGPAIIRKLHDGWYAHTRQAMALKN